MKSKLFLILLFVCLYIPTGQAQSSSSITNTLPSFATKYNQKLFGENVFVFDPSMDMKEIQKLIDTLYNLQHPRESEFSLNRYALFFKPGTYQVDLKLGYYMHILGLGKSPDDVVIEGVIISKGLKNGNVTLNFWRAIENLTIVTPTGELNIWGVSQAAPLRRMHIKGDIQLHDNGWASGGFISDSKIEGNILAGGQQQWFTRNADINKWDRGSWNIMFMGVPNAPEDRWPENQYTVIEQTPVIREKPYLVMDKSSYKVQIPAIKTNSTGASWTKGEVEISVPLKGFYIARSETDNSGTINSALSKGKNIFFTPGIYSLDQSLKVTRPGTLMLGVGMTTLVSANGNPVMEISDADGITVCGLTVDAGKTESETLMRVGETKTGKRHSENPIFLYDIFMRVGGYGTGTTSSCLVINSNDVVVDHTWLWRADHGKEVAWDKNTSKNGLIVNGDNVTVYGLFCEHFQEYQTLWNGNGGEVYFYQSEMPYDPPTVEAFKHGSVNGYASYKVADGVTSHKAWGLGIYCVFFKAPVVVDQAIETPAIIEKDIHHKIIYWLYGGHKESIIKSIINGKGGHVDVNTVKRVMK